MERVWSVTRLQDEMLMSARERAVDVASRGRMAFEQDVESAQATLRLLAERQAELASPRACSAIFEAALAAAPNVQHLTLTDSAGTVTCSTLKDSVGHNYVDRPHIFTPLQSGTWYISDLIKGRVLQQPTIFVGLPLIGTDGETEGLLLARLHLGWFSRFTSDNERFEGSFTVLIDSTGNYAAEFPETTSPPRDAMLLGVIARNALARSEGSAELSEDGRDVLVGFTRLALNNAHLAVVLDKAEALGSTTRVLRDTILGFAAISLLVGAGVWIGGSRYIVRPIERIAGSLAALGRGEDMKAGGITTGIEELRPIELARDEMALRLADRERALREANGRLQALASSDPLTRIANRRAFDTYLAEVWKGALEAKTSIGLIILDVDHFKSFNDIYGHMAGDQCLRDIATTLSQEMRSEIDLVARLGGEEFVVLLPHTDPALVESVAYRLRRAVEALAILHTMAPYGILTVSVGYASCAPADGEPPGSLLGHADEALYRAKREGRNKVRGYKGEAA